MKAALLLLGGCVLGGDLSSRQLIIGQGIDLLSSVGALTDGKVEVGGTYHVKAFENEPIEITLQTGSKSLMDVKGLHGNWGRPSGFLNETGSIWTRPRQNGDNVTLFLSDLLHGTEGNITVVFHTLEGYDSRLYDIRPSVGYLEPKFSKSHYAYFLRLPEGPKNGKLRLTAVDDKLTECTLLENGSTIKGSGLMEFEVSTGGVLSLECKHPRDQENPIRYLIQTVEQKGGSTRLKQLQIIGGDLDQQFDPSDRGVYTVGLPSEDGTSAKPVSKGWISFRPVPENKRANVTIEGFPVDPNSWTSPYFRIPLGETRLFHIGVQTPKNAVQETYTIAVSRTAPANGKWSSRYLSLLANGLTAISSTRAYHALNNFHVLQYLSAVSQSRGLNEKWYPVGGIFHKFNWNDNKRWIRYVDDSNEDAYNRHSAYYTDDASTPPTPYIAQDVPFGHKINRWALNLLPNALALPPNSADGSWMESMIDRDGVLLELDRLSKPADKFWMSSKISPTEDVENDAFFECLEGDDDCVQVAPTASSNKRMLLEIDHDRLMDELEANYQNSEMIIKDCNRLLTILYALPVIGLGWLTYLTVFKRVHGLYDLSKIYPRWLKPMRFWIFVLDICYIAITQSTFSILFSPLKQTSIRLPGGIITTPYLFGLTVGCSMFVVFVLGFIVYVINSLRAASSQILFANIFSRWHDSEIKMVKAFYQPLSKIPVIGRLFEVEIKDVVPIVVRLSGPSLESKGSYTYSPIFLNEEPRKEAPWLTGHALAAFANDKNVQGESTVALRDRHAMKYYRHTDETAIFLDLEDYHEGQYFNVNAKAMHEFPDATVGHFKKCVLNNYGQKVECHPQVQLKHLPCIADSFEQSTMCQCITGRENLDMPVNDELSNVIAKAQRGTPYWWLYERVAVILSIGGATYLTTRGSAVPHSTYGPLVYGVFATVLIAVAIPGAISTSLSDYWYQMETDYYLAEKLRKYQAEMKQKFRAFPWRDKKGETRYLQINQENEKLAERYMLYRTWSVVMNGIYDFCENQLWRSRMAHLIRNVMAHQAFTETMKALLCMCLMYGATTTKWSVNSSITICCLALLMINMESLAMFIQQLRVMCQELYYTSRAIYLSCVDITLSSEFSDRLAFYVNRISQAMHANAVSFIYDGYQSEAVHEMTINDVVVVNNQMGTVMPGQIESTNMNERKMQDEENPLTWACYGMQKTLHLANGIGVYRNELYRALPIEMPMVDICAEDQIVGGTSHEAGAESSVVASSLYLPMARKIHGKLVGTFQIVNHNYIRYIPGMPHTRDDDSFLSFYTDPKLVPTAGVLRKQYLGAGMVAQFDPALRIFRIRGPGIEKGKKYDIKITDKKPDVPSAGLEGEPDSDLYSEPSECVSSEHERRVTCEERTVCSSPGVLNVPVPLRMTPDFSRSIQVHKQGGDVITIDPALSEVVWDMENRIMILYHEDFLVSVSDIDEGDNVTGIYTISWTTRPGVSACRQKFVSTQAERDGELIVQLDADFAGSMYLSRSSWIRVRANDKSVCLDLDPNDTNAHEFPLTGSIRVPRGLPGDQLVAAETRLRAELDTWGNALRNPLWDIASEDRIPCTVVCCVDPVAEDYRVEPDFEAARRKVESRISVLKALRNQAMSKTELWRVWPQVMTQSDYVNFWRRHLSHTVLENGKRFIDPMQHPNHPQILAQKSTISMLIPSLVELLIQKANEGIDMYKSRANILTQWRNVYDYNHLDGPGGSYGDETLFDLYNNWQRARAERMARGTQLGEYDIADNEVELLFEKFKTKRSLYQKSIPGFCYPMIINKQFISRKGNWEAQFNQWTRQLVNWLKDEEVARDYNEAAPLFTESYYPVISQFMMSLKQNIFKPEDLRKGRTASVLHYVTNSLAVRGPNYYWRPDPLGAMFGAVRVWKPSVGGVPSPSDSFWMSCHVKLTGNSLKIYRADGLYNPQEIEYDWNKANGWRIPLDCFEKADVMVAGPHSDDGGNVHLKTLTGLLVFRKNMCGLVDDSYVETIQNPNLIDNKVVLRNGDFVVSNGFDVPRSQVPDDISMFEINEPSEDRPNECNILPLMIRLFPRDLARWDSVIRSCGMHYKRSDQIPRNYYDPRKQRDLGVPSTSEERKVSGPVFTDETPGTPVDTAESYTSIESTHEIIIPDEGSPKAESIEEVYRDILPDFSKPFKGEYDNWRYKGTGKMQNKGEVVYQGGWKDGQRYGENCVCSFRDPEGNTWQYTGGFYADEFAGEGELVLKEGGPSDAGPMAIKRFKGVFNLPKNKEFTRNGSLPYHEDPAIDQSKLAALFNQAVPQVKVIDDADASEDSTVIVLDDRAALSVGGDDIALALPLGKVADDFHKNRAKFNSQSSLSSQDTLGDGVLGTKRYSPHQLFWTRKIDPNLGYQGLSSRFGTGIVEYANGCTFDKKDGLGLFNGMPSSGGELKCPICPLTYVGYMYHGKPEGKGMLQFRYAPGSVGDEWMPAVEMTYKGEWKNGKRNGFGVLTAFNGCLVAKGQWTDDMLDGEHCSLEISGPLLKHSDIRVKSYYGGCKMGKPEGRGELTFKKIKQFDAKEDVKQYVVYKGFFKNGVRDGPQGVMIDEEGQEIYRGGFENDVAHGRVVRYKLPKEGMYTGNEIYVGNCKNGELSGLGTLYDPARKQIVYDGMWMQNVPGGEGVRVLSSGDTYEGQFVNGKAHGNGTLRFADGRVYEGPWVKNLPHGVGRLDEGGQSRILQFQNGKVMKPKGGMCTGEMVEDDAIPPFPKLDLGGHNYHYWDATCKVKPNWIQDILMSTVGAWDYHEKHKPTPVPKLAQYVSSPTADSQVSSKTSGTNINPMPSTAHQTRPDQNQTPPSSSFQSTPGSGMVPKPQAPPSGNASMARKYREAVEETEVRVTILDAVVQTARKNSNLMVYVHWGQRSACTGQQRSDSNLKASWSEVKKFCQSTAYENLGFIIFEGDTKGKPLAFGLYDIMSFMIKHSDKKEHEESCVLQLESVDGTGAGRLNIRIALKPKDPNEIYPRNEDSAIYYNNFPEKIRHQLDKQAQVEHVMQGE